jgi:hypothetical protein
MENLCFGELKEIISEIYDLDGEINMRFGELKDIFSKTYDLDIAQALCFCKKMPNGERWRDIRHKKLKEKHRLKRYNPPG